jgi:hypothetical protein
MRRIGLLGIWLACIICAVLTLFRMLWCVLVYPDRAHYIAVALDRAGNGAANGDISETISSRANRARAEGRPWGCVLCKLLDWIKKDHCADSAGK